MLCLKQGEPPRAEVRAELRAFRGRAAAHKMSSVIEKVKIPSRLDLIILIYTNHPAIYHLRSHDINRETSLQRYSGATLP
jgi:hypothetical protein